MVSGDAATSENKEIIEEKQATFENLVEPKSEDNKEGKYLGFMHENSFYSNNYRYIVLWFFGDSNISNKVD